MINRHQVESILKINDVPIDAPDETISSVLLGARYTQEEVDHALKIIRPGYAPKKKDCEEGLHRVFRTDEGLKPQEISDLLNIEVSVDNLPDIIEKNNAMSGAFFGFIVVLSLFVATSSVLMYMYVHDFGPFHPTAGLSHFNDFSL